MALTLGGGPLASHGPNTTNYRIEGPAHRLLWQPFPRRVRALFGGEVVLDSDRAALLHESNLLPQLYVPREDVHEPLLLASDHRTHCPFKGDAAYFSVRAGERVAENAVWHYPEPLAGAAWLAGQVSVEWAAMDAWFDEDDEVRGHLRDPYHRVDIRGTSRLVQVMAEGLLAESRRAKVLSETGLPNRHYLPRTDVDPRLLEPSATHAVCPYKGTATYYSVRTDAGLLRDAAFSYLDPLDGARDIAGHVCFLGDGVRVSVG